MTGDGRILQPAASPFDGEGTRGRAVREEHGEETNAR